MSVVDKRPNFLVVKNEHAERRTWTWRLNQKWGTKEDDAEEI